MTTLKFRYWLSLLSALLLTASAYSQSVQYADTANMLAPYLRKTDTANLVSKYLRKSDTTIMLVPYLRKIDTSFMLTRYLRKTDTAFMMSRYLRKTDTAFMMSRYLRRTDTAFMLSPYLRKLDTTLMLSRYLRRADTATIVAPYLRRSDTSQMLSGYLRSGNLPSITGKMNYTDTLNMLLGYLRKGDTSQMLSGYLRSGNLPSITGKMNYTDTLNMLLGYLRKGDTSQMLSGYLRSGNLPSISGKMNYTDTLNMLLGYLRKGDTSQMLSGYLRSGNLPSISGKMNYADTLAMLQNYLRKTDTASLVAGYLRKSDTATMLKNYVNIAALPAAIAANTVVPSLEEVLNKGNVSSLAATLESIKTNSPTLLLNNGADTAASLSFVRSLTGDKISGTGTAYNNYFGFHGFVPRFSANNSLQNGQIVDMGAYGIHYEGVTAMGGVTIGAAGYPLGFDAPTTLFVNTGTAYGYNWGLQVKSQSTGYTGSPNFDVTLGVKSFIGAGWNGSTKISAISSGSEIIAGEFNPGGIHSYYGLSSVGNAQIGGRANVNGAVDNANFHLNVLGNGKFSGNLTSSSFVKAGGTNTQYLMADGSTSTASPSLLPGNGISGYLPKWTGVSDLGNSQIRDDGGGVTLGNISKPYQLFIHTPSLGNNYGMATGLQIYGEASTGDPSWPLYNHSINFKAAGDLGGGWSSDMNFIIFNGVNPSGYKKVMTIHNYGINVNGEVLSKYVSANYLRVLGTTSGAIEFKAPSAAVANQSYTLPSSTGSNGQVLTTDGTGVLNWTTGFTGAGTNGYLPKWTGANAIGNSSLFESGGNIGIGVLPSAWQTMTGLQVGEAGSFASKKFSEGNVQTMLGNNVFYDNTGFKYISSEAASMMRMVNNQFQFNIAGTGTANGLITFNQAMTLQSSGNLSLGTIADNGIDKLQVNGSANFSGNVKSSSFVKLGGTASQYLMADGSISTLPSFMGGSGTTNYIPKFTSSGAIGNSQIFDNGENILINTSSDNGLDKLQLNGSMSVTNSIKAFGLEMSRGRNNVNGNVLYGTGLSSVNLSGSSNTAIGLNNLTNLEIGNNNTVLGQGIGYHLWNPVGNVYIGNHVASDGQYNSYNTAVGYSSGGNNGSGNFFNNNTFLGAFAGAPGNGLVGYGSLSNSTAIGYNAKITASNQIVLGNTSVTDLVTTAKIQANGFSATGTNPIAGHIVATTLTSNGPAVINSTLAVTGALTGTTASFSSTVTANRFNKIGGTSTQYLMADGSVSTLPSFMGGSGTVNYMPKFTSATTIGNSQIFDNGTNVGIGIAGPRAKFELSVGNQTSLGLYSIGAAITSQGGQNNNLYQLAFGYNASNANYGYAAIAGLTSSNAGFNSGGLIFATRSVTTDIAPIERMRITSGGNALIGTTTDNGVDKLQVSGSVAISSNVSIGGQTGAAGVSVIPSMNYSFGEGSGLSYVNLFRQASTAASVLANGYKYSGTAGGFASSISSAWAKSAIAVGFNNGSISFFADPSTTVANGTNITPTERMRITSAGNALIGTTTDNGLDKLQVNGSGRFTTSLTANSFIKIGGTSSQYLMADGSISTLPSFMGGSGTSNYISKFTSAGTIGNSQLFDNGTNVGVGTTSPAAKLDVVGSSGIRVNEDGAGTKVISIRSNFAGVDPAINVSTNNALLLQTNNTERMRISSGGNTIIATTTDNGVDKLQVNGSILSNNSGIKIGSTATSIASDGSSLYLKAAGNTYLNSASNAYVTNAGGASFNGTVGIGGYSGMPVTAGGSLFISGGFASPDAGRILFGDGTGWKMHLSSRLNSVTTDLFTFQDNGNLSITGNATANRFVKAGGTASQYLMADGSISTLPSYMGGSGTINYIPKFTSAAGIGNSQLFDNGTSVGIGTTNNGGDGGVSPRLAIANPSNVDKFVGIGYDNAGDYGFIHSIHRAATWKNLVIQAFGGNVGIGTTAPSSKFHIVGTSKFVSTGGVTTPLINLMQSNDVNGYYLSIDNVLDGRMELRNDAGTTIQTWQRGSGNVGIGTTSPSAKLDVNGTFRANGIGANATPVSVGTSANYVRFLSSGADFYVGTESSTSGSFFPGSNAYDNVFYSSNAYNFINGGVSRMRINSNGNVGIGSTNPQANLSIKSGSNVDAEINSLPDGISIQSFNRTSSAYGDISFLTNASGPSLLINNEGQVCIGCTTTRKPAAYKLAVEGGIAARSLRITQVNPWADYVFDKKYQLKPLDEVEKYIQQNHHLPDMPSAATVAEEGIDVAEIQSKLLSKIEELTLYVIELKKEVDTLKKNQPKKTKTNK